jgi:hypothetical protein
MSEFVHFQEINPDISETWSGKKVLSIDIDWAHDDVLSETIDILEESGVKACFFVTHKTALLGRIRSNSMFELGLHPNFDLLLTGEATTSAMGTIEALIDIVPEAKVLRSHGMTTSGRWLELYRKAGITHLSNYLMFGDRNIHPFPQLNGLIEAPVYFADDGLLFQRESGMCTFDVDRDIKTQTTGLEVYNFHPIHIFLNSETAHRYSSTKKYFRDPVKLRRNRFTGVGARSWLMQLLS